jgi:hypothetical protein
LLKKKKYIFNQISFKIFSSILIKKGVIIAVLKDSKLEASDLCDVTFGCGTSSNSLLSKYKYLD